MKKLLIAMLMVLAIVLFGCKEAEEEEETDTTPGTETTDTAAPTNPTVSINDGDSSTGSLDVTLTLSADDDVGVTAYYVSETDSTPSASLGFANGDRSNMVADSWNDVTAITSYSDNVSFELSSGNGQKSVYVWFKDAAGNVSASASDGVTLAQDTSAPTNSVVSINNGDVSTDTLYVTLSVSADDDIGVVAYYASETDSIPDAIADGWKDVSSETSFSGSIVFLLSSGNALKTVYLWFKDADGGVSDATNDSITLNLAPNRIPDTGQTTSFTDTIGEDSDYTINPPSYTDNGNGTVSDNVTGLIWQKENTTYSIWSEAAATCNDLSLAGFSDWRLPTVQELHHTMDYEKTWPVCDTAVFPDCENSFWTSNTSANFNDYAWAISFGTARIHKEEKTDQRKIRCVRGRRLAFGALVDNGDGTVTDDATELMWQQTAEDLQETTYGGWLGALSHCEGLSLAGHIDWRLPNVKELMSMIDYSRKDFAVNTTYFFNDIGFDYFSSTAADLYSYDDSFYNVGSRGGSSDEMKFTTEAARCVRGGAPPSNPSISINSGDVSTDSLTVTLSVSATDDIGVTGYYASETDSTPDVTADGWTDVTADTSYSADVSFTLSNEDGTKTVYVWFKDAARNVSTNASDTITVSGWMPPYGGMVSITGGTFQMGDSNGAGSISELPIHSVTVGDFNISDHEVTASEYKACVDDSGCTYGGSTTDSNRTYDVSGSEDHPMNFVSWEETQDYIAWLNGQSSSVYRLCSEAEWEYAARAGTTTKYSCGDADSCLNDVAWWSGNNSPAGIKTVKTKQANAWGLYDMHGNVLEWVQDWLHTSYSDAPTDGSAWESPTSSDRMVRGGAFSQSAYYQRSARRPYASPDTWDAGIGFRLCSAP